jgi:hypothetical protein
LVLHHEAKCELLNDTQNDGAKLAIHVLGTVYVVHDNFPIQSTQFIQYITSHTLRNSIRLLLVMSVHVVMAATTHASVIVTNFLVVSWLCLTTNTSLAGVALR